MRLMLFYSEILCSPLSVFHQASDLFSHFLQKLCLQKLLSFPSELILDHFTYRVSGHPYCSLIEILDPGDLPSTLPSSLLVSILNIIKEYFPPLKFQSPTLYENFLSFWFLFHHPQLFSACFSLSAQISLANERLGPTSSSDTNY